MVSSYSDAEPLLECFFRVARQENACKDKVAVGRGLAWQLQLQCPTPDTDSPEQHEKFSGK